MAKVVYLFGAGASFHSLPIYKDFYDRLSLFVDFIKPRSEESNPKYLRKYEQIQKMLIELINYRTPDALVRKFYLSNEGQQELLLKKLLSCFFIFEQLPINPKVRNHIRHLLSNMELHHGEFELDDIEHLTKSISNQIDNRYLGFFTTIMSKDEINRRVWPPNVEFISWNYDSQIELAISKIFDINFLECHEYLNIYPYNEMSQEKANMERHIMKLNGTANFFNSKLHTKIEFDLLDDDEERCRKSFFRELFDERNLDNALRFAWDEKSAEIRQNRRKANETLSKEHTVIVIIGYSFPDVNRKIDQEIFRNCKAKKIYVQDPLADDVIERLKGVNSNLVEIVPIRNTDTFHIPVEFWEEEPKASV